MSDPIDRQVHDGRPPQQNVKPKLSTSSSYHQHQKADQRQKEKPPKIHRSCSINSGHDRGCRRDRHQPGDRRPRVRSVESRGRDRREGDTERGGKHLPEDDREATECTICFCSYDNIFKTPKLLSCGHTFCLECLARINVSSRNLKSLPCPVCRKITKIPQGQDLPRLGTNKDIIEKLPPQMQRVQSIRFERSQGKLMLKNHQHQQEAPPTSPKKLTPFKFSTKKPKNQVSPAGDVMAMDVECGGQPQTVIDVGRPPRWVGGWLQRPLPSNWCARITITVVLTLLMILVFGIIPNMVHIRPPLTGNNTL